MQKKNWVSIVCAVLLLVSLAAPAAAGGDLQARSGLLQSVVEWVVSWIPTVSPDARDRFDRGDRPAPVGCETCTSAISKIDVTADPDG